MGISQNSSPLDTMSGGIYRYGETNVGWGYSVGYSEHGSEKITKIHQLFDLKGWSNKPSRTIFPPLKLGAGYSLWGGFGYTISGTMATPTWGDDCECQ